MMQTTNRNRIPFRYTVWDKLEGKLTGQVWALDDDEATCEAIASVTDRGCSFIEEVEVYRVVDA